MKAPLKSTLLTARSKRTASPYGVLVCVLVTNLAHAIVAWSFVCYAYAYSVPNAIAITRGGLAMRRRACGGTIPTPVLLSIS